MWGMMSHEDIEQMERDYAPKPNLKSVSAENFCSTLHVNVNNDKLTDAQFREFVRNTLPIVKYEAPTK